MYGKQYHFQHLKVLFLRYLSCVHRKTSSNKDCPAMLKMLSEPCSQEFSVWPLWRVLFGRCPQSIQWPKRYEMMLFGGITTWVRTEWRRECVEGDDRLRKGSPLDRYKSSTRTWRECEARFSSILREKTLLCVGTLHPIWQELDGRAGKCAVM